MSRDVFPYLWSGRIGAGQYNLVNMLPATDKRVLRVGTLVVGSAVNILVFFSLYRFLSREAVTWTLCWQAAVTSAVLWEGGSRVLSLFSFGSNFSAYGVIGSFLVVQVWIFYNIMVLLIGALVVRVGTRPLKKR